MKSKHLQLSLFTLLILAFVTMAHVSPSKEIEITGTVTDPDGVPLPSVSVLVKDTKKGTVTDFDGKYKIEAMENGTLVFQGLGLNTKEVEISGRKVIDVQMSKDVSLQEVIVTEEAELETIVVTGYRNKTIKRSVSAISVVHADENYNREGYAAIEENGFKKVSKNPLSTFSVDVDRAAYSNVRRFLNSGSLPQPDAVRIEEMINYFDYDYPQPNGDMPFSINSELAKCPWNDDHLLLHIGLQGKEIAMDNLPPSNIVFLLDVSGSMRSPNKLPLLKSSLKLLLKKLRPGDRVAIVVYAGNSGLVLNSTPASEQEKIINALEQLQAGGSTAGGAGLKLAYKVAEENLMKDGNNRIILATDGDFNVGVSSDGAMKRLIEEKRKSGISISVLGFGMGNLQDSKMETIADHGNGNYAYIDNLLEARKVLVEEFGGTFFTIAKDVKFQLEFNPATVAEYRLVGYENRLLDEEDFKDDKKDAGEIGAGHTVTALYEIIPAKGSTHNSKLKYQNSQLSNEGRNSNDLATIKLRFKKPKGDRSRLVERIVKNNVNRNTSENFRFSAAVAEFGMLLRNSEFKGAASYEGVRELAKSALGEDEQGYRGEMVRLVEIAEGLGE